MIWLVLCIAMVISTISSSTIRYSKTMQLKSVVKASIKKEEWLNAALSHKDALDDLLYPRFGRKKGTKLNTDTSLKTRMHAVKQNPIYNFLHTYYRYSTLELQKWSPGRDCLLEGASKSDHGNILSEAFLSYNSDGCIYTTASMNQALQPVEGDPNSRYGWINLATMRDVLKATTERPPFLSCYGLHEWAMLYSGRNQQSLQKHQQQLNFRLSQKDINSVVESGKLRCTHFDAWRFFHPDSQEYNIINPLSRKTQADYEQPGCIHANMDLFKYAFTLYPLVPAKLLLESLQLAIKCRKIDMRASPYDVTAFDDCEHPICVETKEGKMEYMTVQAQLAEEAVPIRAAILEVYNAVLDEMLR